MDCRTCAHARPIMPACDPLSLLRGDPAALAWFYLDATEVDGDGNCTNPDSTCPAYAPKES